jgi:ribonuclease T2
MNDMNFDYFLLSLQWPATACQHMSPCHIPAGTKYFTIHGLWPNRNHSRGPEHCEGAGSFDFNQIKSLLPELREYWTDYKEQEPSFWHHEWEAHGSCAVRDHPTLNTQKEYFAKTLDLKKKMNLIDALAQNSIVPGPKRYNLRHMESVLGKSFGGVPHIFCYGQHVSEIRFCYDKSLNIFDCGAPQRVENNGCGDEVSIPAIREL